MGKLIAGATMSLDGFIAGQEDTGFEMARQALEAGPLDEIGVDFVPVILGSGTPLRRPRLAAGGVRRPDPRR